MATGDCQIYRQALGETNRTAGMHDSSRTAGIRLTEIHLTAGLAGNSVVVADDIGYVAYNGFVYQIVVKAA